jgi:hypothetical protein
VEDVVDRDPALLECDRQHVLGAVRLQLVAVDQLRAVGREAQVELLDLLRAEVVLADDLEQRVEPGV